MEFRIDYDGKKSYQEIVEKDLDSNLLLLESIGAEPENLLVKGDNFAVLKSFLENNDITGKVRLVYIDPPYSSQQIFRSKSIWYQDDVYVDGGEDAYEDSLSGSDYLEFLRERLIILRELLADDGSIYIHLDQNMIFPVKVLMDEIFGESNFRNFITRRKCSSKNYTRNKFGNITDYLLYYSKGSDPVWNRPFKAWSEKKAKKEYPRIEEESGRRFKPVPVYAQGERNGATGEPWRGMDPPEGKHWFTSPEKLDQLDEEGRIYWSPTGNPRKKVYLDESEGIPYSDLWMEFRDPHNQNVSMTGYPTEKNLNMLKVIIEASSNEGDIVLDAFCGSGTTLEAAQWLKRRWIGIDASDTAIKVSKNRLQDLLEQGRTPMFGEQFPGFEIYTEDSPKK